MGNILGLDLGNKTGWAVFRKDGRVLNSGVIDVSKVKDKPAKWDVYDSRIYSLLSYYGVDCIYFEEAKRHLGIYAAHSFGGLKAIMELNVYHYDYRIKIHKLSPTEIKKQATGNGRASKKDMIKAAAIGWPNIEIIDDNHADALWIGWIGFSRNKKGEKE